MHLNIRSLWSKFDQLREILSNSNVTVCGISESWLNCNMDDNLIYIPNYTCVRLDRTWTNHDQIVKKGGGICCYVRSDLSFSDSELSHFNISLKDIEMLWITLNQPKMKKIIICNIYRPPYGNTASFCDILTNSINSLADMIDQNFELFIMGDFDINYRATEANGYKDIKWFEQRTGLRQLISEITRYSHLNSCIDLIFTNSNEISCSGTLDLNISDHQAIYITRKHIT